MLVYVLSELEYDGPVHCIMHGVYADYLTAVKHALNLRVSGSWWLTITKLILDQSPVTADRANRRHISDDDIDEVLNIDPSLRVFQKTTFRNIWVYNAEPTH